MIRKTYHLPTELTEKVEAYAYWARMAISVVLTDALQQYFEDKKFKPIPGDCRSSVRNFFNRS